MKIPWFQHKYLFLVFSALFMLTSCQGGSDVDDDDPQSSELDMAEPDIAEPDMAEPDVVEPDMTEPDMAEPVLCDKGVWEGNFDSETDEISILEGYSSVTGDVMIDHTNLTDLRALHCLESVGGSLRLWNNEALDTLDGLSNLRVVEQNLLILFNNALESLHGLEGLTYVGLNLQIDGSALENLHGLESLGEVGGTVEYQIQQHAGKP